MMIPSLLLLTQLLEQVVLFLELLRALRLAIHNYRLVGTFCEGKLAKFSPGENDTHYLYTILSFTHSTQLKNE